MENRIHSAVQHLDNDVSQMIAEIYLPDEVSKYTLDYTLKKFLKNNYVMGMRSGRAGGSESCRPSKIPRKIPYDLSRTARKKNMNATRYVKEARILAKKARALKKLRETLPGCEIGEHEVSVPEHGRRARHDIEWRGMKMEFNVVGLCSRNGGRVNH